MKAIFALFLAVGLASIPAYAAKNSEVVKLSSPVKVGSTQLAAGNVTVTWTGTGSSVKLTLEQKGISPITVPATLIEEKHDRNGFTTDSRTGAPVLQTIQLRHIKLSIEDETPSGQ